MADTISISDTRDKEQKYLELLPQIKALIEDEENLTANLANVAAALHEVFNFFWVGFYMVKEDQLVLGPFQGPVACTRISFGKGVCGTAWEQRETIIVPNVEEFPGHIACNAAARSEIVVPVLKEGKVIYVLDVDSDQLNAFDSVDRIYLEQLAEILSAIS